MYQKGVVHIYSYSVSYFATCQFKGRGVNCSRNPLKRRTASIVDVRTIHYVNGGESFLWWLIILKILPISVIHKCFQILIISSQLISHCIKRSAILQEKYDLNTVEEKGICLVIKETHQMKSTTVQSNLTLKVNVRDNAYYRCELQLTDGTVCRHHTGVKFAGMLAHSGNKSIKVMQYCSCSLKPKHWSLW